MIKNLISYVLTAAIRDKIFISFFLLLIVTASLSMFFGSSALTEQDQFATVFAAGALRLVAIFTLILFIVFYFRRSFDNRDVDFIFSRPVTRLQYLLAHFIAFAIISLIISVSLTLLIAFFKLGTLDISILYWGITIFFEMLIVSCMAIFYGVALSNAVSASLAACSLYLLGRLIGDVLGIIELGAFSWFTEILSWIMTVISFFIPRLDLMAQSSWLIYGFDDFPIYYLALQSFVFIGLLLSATYIDLKRRQF